MAEMLARRVALRRDIASPLGITLAAGEEHWVVSSDDGTRFRTRGGTPIEVDDTHDLAEWRWLEVRP